MRTEGLQLWNAAGTKEVDDHSIVQLQLLKAGEKPLDALRERGLAGQLPLKNNLLAASNGAGRAAAPAAALLAGALVMLLA